MPNCILIGAGSGISEAIARRFGQGGFQIGLIARSAANLKQQVNRLAKHGNATPWA